MSSLPCEDFTNPNSQGATNAFNYQFADGSTTPIEVNEEVGAFYLGDLTDEVSNERKETRRHVSLSRFTFEDQRLFADGTNIERSTVESDAVRRVLAKLTERQRYLTPSNPLPGSLVNLTNTSFEFGFRGHRYHIAITSLLPLKYMQA